MEISDYISSVEAIHQEGRNRGLFFQTCQDDVLKGRSIRLHNQDLVSFSSCSYLGLEQHPALITGACEATQKWGTQFSSSRGYLSAPPYEELELLLSKLFGGYALVTSTTTLGHQSTLGTLATEQDAIVLDHQVHHSVHLAAQIARAGGANIQIIRHDYLEQSIDKVTQLAKQHKKVWFCCDGVFSMYGDLAPIRLLQALLDAAPNIRLYVDDAHGMSWTGRYGRGSFLSRMPMDKRIVVATSLNKAFAAAGGCIIFQAAEERERVRMCGGPQLFSGPLQPPMLGAALASAKLHLSEELKSHQRKLRSLVDFCNDRIIDLGLPLLARNEAPIFFICMGAPKISLTVAQRMIGDGIFVNVSMYPAVPMKRSGIRLGLTALHTEDDIARALDSMHRHASDVLHEEGISRLMIDETFARAIPQEALQSELYTQPTHPSPSFSQPISMATPLTVRHCRTIHDIDPALWNPCMGHVGTCSWHAMATWEQLFSHQSRKENNWQFHYVIVSDAQQKPVCMTFFTTTLIKDDMMMRAKVSSAIEQKRKTDPYFLTSTCLMMGSLCSEGNHLYLDRTGPWKSALRKTLEVAMIEYDRLDASLLMLRDLPADDPEMDTFMIEHGFFKSSVLASHTLALDHPTEEQWLHQLDRCKRRYVRKYMLQPAELLQTQVYRADSVAPTPAQFDYLYQLYRQVAQQKLRINVFALPENILPMLLQSPAWELVTFTLPATHGGPAHGLPVAFYIAHMHDTWYTPFFCGLDYDYVASHGIYRQLLAQVVRRARLLDMKTIHLGMDADFIKSRLGTTAHPNSAYIQARDHFQGTLLREIVANISSSPM